MSHVSQLLADLNSLASDSKKRHPDVRHSVDEAIKLLKHYKPTTPLAEIQDADTQKATSHSLTSACDTGNVKLNNIALPIINRLLLLRFIPSANLQSVMKSFAESSHLAVDIQLKILQCLPLFSNYANDLTGSLIIDLIDICSNLTSSNRSPIVMNAASATLQQLFSDVFERAANSQGQRDCKVEVDSDEIIEVDQSSYEAYLILADLGRIITNNRPTYMKSSTHIKVLSALDICENLLHGHEKLFQTHQELAYLLRVEIVPSLLKMLDSQSKSYALIVRVLRIIQILLSSQLQNLKIEIEIIISFLNHILLDNEEDEELRPRWEKILVLEMYKNLFHDFGAIKSIFQTYDHDNLKKDVLRELFTILDSYLQDINPLRDDIVRPPRALSEQQSGSSFSTRIMHISRENSSLKTPILDHLDKSDPPATIPSTYPIYLIFEILVSFSVGVSDFVTSLSAAGEKANDIESDVDFINAIMESTASEVSLLYSQLLYTSTDNSIFQVLLKSFQRFTHTLGLLGIDSLRDKLLVVLSKTVIENVSRKSIQQHEQQQQQQQQGEYDEKQKEMEIEKEKEKEKGEESGSLLEEQRKQLMAIGGSLVDTISATIQNSTADNNNNENSASASQAAALRPRNLNPRQVQCLRVLLSLASSLGSTLGRSWSVIWITLQWAAYFLEGADSFSGFSKNSQQAGVSPQLNAADFEVIEVSYRKLFDSIAEIPPDAFKDLLLCFIELSDAAFSDNSDNSDEVGKFGLKQCPYNKSFPLSTISKVTELNPVRFIIEDDTNWEIVSAYFTKLSSNRNLSTSMRLFAATAYGKVVEVMAERGFNAKTDAIIEQTSVKTLKSLNLCLQELFGQGIAGELLMLNCETEIHLMILKTLHRLIEKYDSHYQSSWKQVFDILNTPFKGAGDIHQSHLKDKFQLLLEHSFDTLKLILDEFLSTLPIQQLKFLVDTLVNFARQTNDLNISFSAVSYFWLVSDCFRSRLDSFSEDRNIESIANWKSEGELVEFIDAQDECYASYFSLDLYLLLCLAKLSKEEMQRAQVREGAIHTFFQIIDAHGPILKQNWSIIYEIAIPNVVSICPNSYSKEWSETLRLLLEGFTTMYRKYFTVAVDSNVVAKWQIYVDYMQTLINFNLIEVNLIVFGALQDLLRAPISISSNSQVTDLLFNLWSRVPVEYDLVNPEYQESVVSHMKVFQPLYRQLEPNLTIEQVDIISDLFNKTARYPVIPLSQLDDVKPSKLQAAILDNIREVEVDDSQIQAAIAQLLTNIIVYPFGVKARIDQKLQNNPVVKKNYKIPTFTAVSFHALLLLDDKLKRYGYVKLLDNEKNLVRTMKALHEIVENKAGGQKRIVNEESLGSQALWQRSQNLLLRIIESLLKRESDPSVELLNLITKSLTLTLRNEDGEFLAASDEACKIEQYLQLKKVVVPQLVKTENPAFVLEFLEEIYNTSYLYDLNEVEKNLILSNVKDNHEAIEQLTTFSLHQFFGTTEPLHVFPNSKIRINCLKELYEFSTHPTSYKPVAEVYLLRRICFALRRTIADLKLVVRRPLPMIQLQELRLILEMLDSLKEISLPNVHLSKKMNQLLIELIPHAKKVAGMGHVLSQILIKKGVS
ncbi:uncharacterized protein LODBEIA_P07920 [Lodderomyces beijingensis]|uniref:Uncharacterized protein n=1 Tax=Lodderomyces beijingensis TaxID=1775926 RepID=A0ABP0ZEH6_9ASCO